MRILESGSGENGSGENGSGPPMTPPPPPTRLTYDGMAMYVGPLKGCTVFVDANGDGVHDSGALLTPILTVNPHPHLTLTPQPSTSTPTL